MTHKRGYNFSKVRKTHSNKKENIECKKRMRYMEMKDLLSNIY